MTKVSDIPTSIRLAAVEADCSIHTIIRLLNGEHVGPGRAKGRLAERLGCTVADLPARLRQMIATPARHAPPHPMAITSMGSLQA